MYPLESFGNRSRFGCVKRIGAGLLALGLVAGCSAALPSTSSTTIASSSFPSSSPSTSPSTEPSAPTSAPSAASFTTPGALANWTGLSWGPLPANNPLATADPGVQVLAWSHGYVIYGSTGGGESGFVWTSPDGQTWTQVTAIVAPRVLVAASPSGLVARRNNGPDSDGLDECRWRALAQRRLAFRPDRGGLDGRYVRRPGRDRT